MIIKETGDNIYGLSQKPLKDRFSATFCPNPYMFEVLNLIKIFMLNK
jgi:hypothetical protein